MKVLKNILIVAAAIIVVLFLIVLFMPADGEQDEATATDVEQTDAADFYGTDNSNVATNEDANGTVIEMDAQMYLSKVANYNSDPNSYIGGMPCVVDFNASWCGPCQQLAPVLAQMAQKYAGKVAFYSVDIDNNSEVSDAYGIQSIPTLFFCSNGQIQSYTGAPSEDELESMIADM